MKGWVVRMTIVSGVLLLFSAVTAWAQSGGSYSVQQNVIGGIGGSASGGSFGLDGTGGQPLAGGESTGGGYGVTSGYWPALLIAPTAALGEINGKVLGMRGEPIRNVTVTIVGGSLTTPITVKTNNFGVFSFRGLEAGQMYIVQAVSRRFGFEQPNQAVTLMDEQTVLVFRAAWVN